MEIHGLVPDRQTLDQLLTGHWEFANPREILAGISAAEACRRVDPLPYSIAELVAHLNWWQRRRLHLARGGEWEDFELKVDDWPRVAEAEWDGLAADFLASFDELLAVADDPAAIAREQFGDRNVGTMLVSHTTHNAYHLGQIALLRRLQGTWREEQSA